MSRACTRVYMYVGVCGCVGLEARTEPEKGQLLNMHAQDMRVRADLSDEAQDSTCGSCYRPDRGTYHVMASTSPFAALPGYYHVMASTGSFAAPPGCSQSRVAKLQSSPAELPLANWQPLRGVVCHSTRFRIL